MSQSPAPAQHVYPCQACGARVEFAPGTTTLRCPYCGHEQQIQQEPTKPKRRWHPLTERLVRPPAEIPAHQFVCQSCGAHTESDALSSQCQFCAAPVVAEPADTGLIAPDGVLPFEVDRGKARDAVREWTKSRWLAPSDLKKVTESESAKSTYLPHWGYNTDTVSTYRGERGVTRGSGDNRRTDWYPARGTVSRDFRNVLVYSDNHVDNGPLRVIEPWELKKTRPYQPAFIAGHQTLRYEIEPVQGFEVAKQEIDEQIRADVRRDIGGDQQRIHAVNTQYKHVHYQYYLLPVWVCTYLYHGKPFQVLVNGVSGAVAGSRPFSKIKIALALLLALLIGAAGGAIYSQGEVGYLDPVYVVVAAVAALVLAIGGGMSYFRHR